MGSAVLLSASLARSIKRHPGINSLLFKSKLGAFPGAFFIGII